MTEGRPNAEQAEYWNTIAGPKWLELNDQLDLQLEPYGKAVLDTACPAVGESVVDVGCGCGTTTVSLGKIVGKQGSVLGIDLASAMLERGRELATRERAHNVRFECADAQGFPFPPSSFDLVYSRFGVMFFADPVAAFRNLSRALKPSGRLAFVCWQSVTENPWMSVPMLAAMQHMKIEIPSDPHAPGPFAFADADRVRTILSAAGFTDVQVHELRTEMAVGGGASLDQALDFMLRISPLSRPLAEADDATRSNVIGAIARAMAPFERDGIVRMPSAAWVITAHRGTSS